MTTEQNKKIILRLFKEGVTEKKFQVFDEYISDNFINHGIPYAQPGPKGFKAVVQQFLQGFPDMKITVLEIVAEGATVATRGYLTGTHNGEFMGINATGKTVRIDYIDFWKLHNGKCIENWVQMDMTGLMKQIGSIQHAF